MTVLEIFDQTVVATSMKATLEAWSVPSSYPRQKANNTHNSTIRYFRGGGAGQTLYVQPPVTHSRSHMVTIPNIGGFAGLSYRFPNAKISAGYRADFFFGAKDSGLETRSTTDVGFHGPYATISIGLGG
jgi:hypothetical protein